MTISLKLREINSIDLVMKTRYLLILMPLWAVLISVFFACSNSGREKDIYKIGVSQCSYDAWRDRMNEEIYLEMLFHEDASVGILTANDDNEKQISDIKYFIDNDYDIIIVAPNQAEALTPVLKDAYDKGIPVIMFDRGIMGDSYTTFIEFDNYGIGRKAAEYSMSILDKNSSIIEITGLPGSTPAIGRHAGFAGKIGENCGYRLVASVSGNWKKDRAEVVMDSLLNIYPDVNLVFAHNDLMAMGASKVLKRLNRHDVKVLGVDAVPSIGIQAVIDSVIDATFIYPTDGKMLIRVALDILKGKSPDKLITTAALPPVDIRNAEILIHQNELLDDEINKIRILKELNDKKTESNDRQWQMIYCLEAIAVMLVITISVLVFYIVQRNRYKKTLTHKNNLLEKERDKQKDLYERLNESTRLKMLFFTNITHDLKTPLNLISEPLRVVMSRDYLTADDLVLMKIADKNVMILSRLINHILDYRKYENDKLELQLKEICIRDALLGWIDSFRTLAVKRDISLSIDLRLEANDTLAIDEEKIMRVFFNILSNAFRYSRDNSLITVSSIIDKSNWVLSITDKGCGIPSENLDKIFTPFFNGNKMVSGGSGIGLSIARAFVALHDGKIEVESTVGKGSVFTITIPVRHVSDKPAESTAVMIESDVVSELAYEKPAEKEFDVEKPLVLVVDDNPDVLNMIGLLLCNQYNVITAENGKTGIKFATKYVPDLIICDIMMPEIDGIEFCSVIKNEITTSHIPVLMLTACTLEEDRINSYDNGADGYMSKPFSAPLLMSRCKSLIENRIRIKNLYAAGELGLSDVKAKRIEDLDDRHAMESEFYEKFIDIVRKDFSDPSLSTESIAGQLGLGARQLTRKIKALTNYPPYEIIKDFRMKRARELIIGTEENFSEIAFSIGYSSASYFSKCFKETFGMSPTELREHLKKH